MLLTMASLS